VGVLILVVDGDELLDAVLPNMVGVLLGLGPLQGSAGNLEQPHLGRGAQSASNPALIEEEKGVNRGSLDSNLDTFWASNRHVYRRKIPSAPSWPRAHIYCPSIPRLHRLSHLCCLSTLCKIQ
jgi:hypothetical protein